MNNYLDASRDLIADNTFERIGSLTGKSPRTWPTAGAVTGLAGCILAPALGATLTVISWLISQQRASFYLSRLSTTLFFLTIPLLALGAHCLDLLEARAATPSQSTATLFARIAPLGAGARRGGRHVHKGGVAAALLLLFALPAVSRAQQTVFNVPTTDVLDRGKVYFELDASLKPNDDEALGRSSSFVPRVVVGTGHNVEVGLNVLGNVQPGPDATTLVPSVKWKPYDGGDNGWAFFVGNNLFIPVRIRQYTVGNYAYVAFSKTFRTRTRLTAGGYHFSRMWSRGMRSARAVRLRAARHGEIYRSGRLIHRPSLERLLHPGRGLQTNPEADGLLRLLARQPRPHAGQPLLLRRGRVQLRLI